MQELLAALSDWLGVYLLIVNVATIAVYGADKRRAKQRRWRVPEKTLFLLAIVGGSFGPDGGASYVEIANVQNIRKRNEEIVAQHNC